MKGRLDQVLVERRLARTRSQARDLILRGCVSVKGSVATKAGLEVSFDAEISVAADAQPWVSRGGLKLVAALDRFGFEPAGLVALDIGASSGGFTQVLIERGARRVYAVDVGHGQLDPLLREDPRVANLEGLDARSLDAAIVPEPIGAVVADVSFISVVKVLGPVLQRLPAPGAWLVALVKPQFEVGRERIGKGGIVRSEAARAEAVARVEAWIDALPAWRSVGVIPSPIAGGNGNIEFLIGARCDG